jgi:DHA2 family multidrug resistance protein
VQPGNPVGPLSDGGGPGGSMLDTLNNEITRQAAMVGLIDVFKLMLVLTILVAPLLLIMRKPKALAGPAEVVVD